MILKKNVISELEAYTVEINTNDEKENVVTLYRHNSDQLIMQSKFKKTDEDYIKVTKDIVLKYENGDKTACSDFYKWDGSVI